jgi:hypothetical protein
LQPAFANLQCSGYFGAPRFARRQTANDCGAGSGAGLEMIKSLETFGGEPLMDLGE